MWSSLLLMIVGSFVLLRARSVPEGSHELQPPRERFWKNGYHQYATIPLTGSDGAKPERKPDCDCLSKMRLYRRPKLRTVIRRNDIVMEDPEEALENFLEEYLLRLYLNRELLSPPTPTAVQPDNSVIRKQSSTNGKTHKSRTQKQVQQALPAFQHEKAVYSDEDNYRMTHSSRFYSQEPVPGQLLYPPVSPKFQPVARVYGPTYTSPLSKPRYVSSMLIPHFVNKTLTEPKEIVRNVLRISTTNVSAVAEQEPFVPKRVRYAKNSGYLNMTKLNHEKNTDSGK